MLSTVVCGLGPRGLEHLSMIGSSPGFQLAGVCDSSPERLGEAARPVNVPSFGSIAAMLHEVAPEVVVLAVPPRERVEPIRSIVQSPSVRAVLIEKPLALSGHEASEIISLCQKRDVVPFVFHQLRHGVEFVRLRTAIMNGDLGEIEKIEASCFGKLFDQGPHLVDALLWLLPDFEPISVDAHACDDLKAIARFTPLPPFFTRDTRHPGDAWISADLNLADGTLVELRCGPRAPVPRAHLGPWLQKRIVVHGTRAIAEAHVASHFRMLDRASGTSYETPSPEDGYRAAQMAVYDSVRAVMTEASAQPQDTAGLLTTVQVLEACARSAAAGRPIAIPTTERRPETEVAATHITLSAPPDRPRPRVSVILPMADHRGLWREAVESWTHSRHCAPEDFELVLVLDHTVRGLEESLRSLVREHDLILHRDGVELAQYHTGATHARGDIVFFTEPHCLAEPDAIAEIISFMDDHPVDGLCARTVPICVNAMGRAESTMFESGFREWSKPEHWVKVIIRGFGIRRTAYASLGGFQHEFDRFAEWLLSAQLRSRGYEIVYAPSVAVQHRYGDYFGLFDEDIREFTEGECKFRLTATEGQLIRDYFGEPPEWSHALSMRNAPSSFAMQPLAQRIVRGSRRFKTPLDRATCLGALMRWGAARALASRGLVWKSQATVNLWKLAYWCGLTERQRARTFRGYYMAMTRYCRVRFALRQPEHIHTRVHRNEYALADLDEQELWGFSNLESHQGVAFRWSQPFASIRVNLLPGTSAGSVQLAAVRPIQPDQEIALFLDDVELEITHFDPATWTLQFRLPVGAVAREADCWLSIHSARWRHPEVLRTDARALGLPIRSVQFEPSEAIPAALVAPSSVGAGQPEVAVART